MGEHRGSRDLWTRGGGVALVVIVLVLVLFVRPGGDDTEEPTLDPSAVPGAAEGDQIAGSSAAFSSYLNEFCPA